MSTHDLGVHVTDARRYPHGVPCWVDVTAADLDAAAAFYSGLFGWQLTNAMPAGAPGAYLIATLDGHDVAALAPTDGQAPVWRTYIAVDDADASARALTEAGGSVVVPPLDPGPAGRDVACADPQGAQFHLWQARRRLGAQLVNVPGTWNFSDLHTSSPEAVLPFYASVFGWTIEPGLGAGMIRLPGYGDHLAATVDPDIFQRQAGAPPGFADVVAGVAVYSGDGSGDVAPGWQVRFTVADRDDNVATAQRLGATVLSSADTAWTKEAVVLDPQGARLTLSQFTPPS